MPIELKETSAGKVLEVDLTGKLAREDYEKLVPVAERLIQEHGKIRLLMAMHDFHGWTAGALWEDIKFGTHNFNSFERLAMVGEKKWQQGMAVFCKPFTSAAIRYFDHAALADARAWVEGP